LPFAFGALANQGSECQIHSTSEKKGGARRAALLRWSLLAALAGALSACAPRAALSHHPSSLALDFTWPRAAEPTLRSSFAPPPPPKAVTLHWNPKDYTRREIAEIAGQQCLTFERSAKPASQVARSGAGDAQRFDCVLMIGKAADGAEG